MISDVLFVWVREQGLQKELAEMKDKVDVVQGLAKELVKNNGEHCKAQVKPKLEQMNQRFDIITKRILTGQVLIYIYTCVYTVLELRGGTGGVQDSH